MILIRHGSLPKVVFAKVVISGVHLKGLSHEIDFKNVGENGQILSLIRAAAGF